MKKGEYKVYGKQNTIVNTEDGWMYTSHLLRVDDPEYLDADALLDDTQKELLDLIEEHYQEGFHRWILYIKSIKS